ncbi:uncharacterized membrane protein YkvA (DUF1232 family) [Kibdelosporangium banguiense]|uniref:Uncharacterized membrane protein YkvA (DUF1232 family) n=1 Tax=Kibdelosporangium banguiense TaxID=1365924 RepID=A0ABS4TQ34_9PSEU|nr:YkvA family protein [Kibdelosporangium banguiense]MBP2326515.1 uncharacterized membrane protein YkvA (DUF1232 family) [Kibdelosporangium banguiense]
MPEPGWDVLSALGVVALIVVVVTAVVVVVLAIAMIRRHRKVHQPGVPVSAKVSYYGSIIYAVLPVDLLPDPILVDDIGVLAAALVYVGSVLKRVSRKRSQPLG